MRSIAHRRRTSATAINAARAYHSQVAGAPNGDRPGVAGGLRSGGAIARCPPAREQRVDLGADPGGGRRAGGEGNLAARGAAPGQLDQQLGLTDASFAERFDQMAAVRGNGGAHGGGPIGAQPERVVADGGERRQRVQAGGRGGAEPRGRSAPAVRPKA